MNPGAALRQQSIPELLTVLSSIICMIAGAIVLASWFLGWSWFKAMMPHWVEMRANTAFCFIVAGASLGLLRHENMPFLTRLAGKICASIIMVIGLWTLKEYVFHGNFAIEKLIYNDHLKPGEFNPGRMAPVSAVCFAFLGLALLGLDWKTRSGRHVDQAPPLIAALAGLFAVTGHLYGVRTFYFDIFHYFPIAANTAALFLTLALGVLCARAYRGPLAILSGGGAGSFTARRLLPLALCTPVVLGCLLLWSRRAGYISNETELALLTVLLVILFGALIWHTALSLNRAEASRNSASKLSHEALRKAEVLQRSIFNSANFSCIATDEHGLIQSFNVGAERMLVYAAQEVIHKITLPELADAQEVRARAADLSIEFSSAIVAGFDALVFKAARGMEDICELSYVRKDGVRVPAIIAVTALHDEQAKIIGYLMIGIDNTSRKDVEAAQALLAEGLREQQLYTRSLVESSMDALMMTNPLGVISDVNQQMITLTGRSREELIGAPCRNFFTDPLLVDVVIARVLIDNKVSNYELTLQARTGEETVVSCNVSTFHDRDSTLQGVFAAARDVTERKRFEHALYVKNNELEHASRMKSEFLATMSHELRTPLNAIIGFSEALSDGLMGPLSKRQDEYIGDIFTSGQHLLSLINDILDLSKAEAGMMVLEFEALDIKNLLSISLSMVREKAAAQQISVELELGDDLGVPQLDMRKTKQIIHNLLSNAVKFSATGGRVTLGARRVPNSAVGKLPGAWPVHSFALNTNAYTQFHEFLEICVSDSGIGISRDNMAKLFQAFKQIDSSLARKFEGTGLGLAMVKQLAELHGGAVAVASAEGEGARFAVWLPLRTALPCAAAASSAIAQATDANQSGRTYTVLVVDDDPNAVEVISGLLPPPAYVVVRAYGGSEAIILAQRLQPDLILLDLMMPQVSGFDVVAALQSHSGTARIPVLVVTAKQIMQQDRDVLNGNRGNLINIVEKAGFNRAGFLVEVRRALLPR